MARQSAIPVLITRPEPQASRLAQEIAALCGTAAQPVLTPLMQAVFLSPQLPPGPHSALVLTSETGAEAAARLRAAGAALPHRALCVGDRTAAVAEGFGFAALSAKGAVEDLAAVIRDTAEPGPLLYLHGEDKAGDLAQLLGPDGPAVDSAVVYDQRPAPPSAEALAALAAPGPVIVPLYSPRSTRLFVAALPAVVAATIHPVGISVKAIQPLSEALRAVSTLAERPDGEAMLRAIAGKVVACKP